MDINGSVKQLIDAELIFSWLVLLDLKHQPSPARARLGGCAAHRRQPGRDRRPGVAG